MIEAWPATKTEERILSKCASTAVINADDDEDSDGSKVSDNLREKLVSKENKVVSKKLGKAYIQLVAERNSGHNCPTMISVNVISCGEI